MIDSIQIILLAMCLIISEIQILKLREKISYLRADSEGHYNAMCALYKKIESKDSVQVSQGCCLSDQQLNTLTTALHVIEYSVQRLSNPNECFATEIVKAVERIKTECLKEN